MGGNTRLRRTFLTEIMFQYYITGPLESQELLEVSSCHPVSSLLSEQKGRNESGGLGRKSEWSRSLPHVCKQLFNCVWGRTEAKAVNNVA